MPYSRILDATGKRMLHADGTVALAGPADETDCCCGGVDCGLCGFGTSATVTVAGITICPCDSFNQGISGDPNGTYTVPGVSTCNFSKLLNVFFGRFSDPDCTGTRNPATEEQFTLEFTVNTVAGVTTINASIGSISFQIFGGSATFNATECAAHGPFVITNGFGACVEGSDHWGSGGTITITP
jgi:hypothetical protein